MLESSLIYLPAIVATAGSVLMLWLMHWLLIARNRSLGAQASLPRQLVMFTLTVAALLLVIILFPMTDATRGQIITLLGLVVTGVIALSSTSFVANVMAGLMLQLVRSFNPGDFIRVGPHLGRVTERGLFHTEIQTEDRDLTTIPNLHLATNPVTVVHSTGTIISAELSLGYDVPRTQVEDLLKQAAERASLTDVFVLIMALGDFAVTYRISGFLNEVKNLITAKSNLKKNVLDVLHENCVEIVSPSFMNQRQLIAEEKVIPKKDPINIPVSPAQGSLPEDLIFDKAEVAAEEENLREKIDELSSKIEELNKTRKTLSKEDGEGIKNEIQMNEEHKKHLLEALEKTAVVEK